MDMDEDTSPPVAPVKRMHSHVSPEVAELSTQINAVGTRIRIIEERYLNLRKKTQVTDANMLEVHKRMEHEIKAINNDLLEMRREIDDLRDKMKVMVHEVMDSARKEDLDVVKKYLDLWEPVKFVTTEDVEKIAQRIRDESFNN